MTGASALLTGYVRACCSVRLELRSRPHFGMASGSLVSSLIINLHPSGNLVRLSKFHRSARLASALSAILLVSACTGSDVTTIAGPQASDARASGDLVSAQGTGGLQVFIGSFSICTLRPTGIAKCWGYNQNGELGNGSTNDVTSPTAVGGGLTFSTLSMADYAMCGVSTAGVGYCWGADKLRLPWQTDYRLLPRPVNGHDVFTTIAYGGWQACGLTTIGETKCWIIPVMSQYTPVTVPGAPPFTALVAGYQHQCGLGATGGAFCWGNNPFGQLGIGTSGETNAPVGPILGARRFISIAAGFNHTCAADLGGTAYCWGQNAFGAVGDGTLTDRPLPTRVATTLRFVKVVAGNSHSCGLTKSGTAYCWGNGYSGQVGAGANVYGSLVPIAVQQGDAVFRDIAAGGWNTCGITNRDQVYCWGDNQYNELLDGTATSGMVPTLLKL
jgi:hypothetical protein